MEESQSTTACPEKACAKKLKSQDRTFDARQRADHKHSVAKLEADSRQNDRKYFDDERRLTTQFNNTWSVSKALARGSFRYSPEFEKARYDLEAKLRQLEREHDVQARELKNAIADLEARERERSKGIGASFQLWPGKKGSGLEKGEDPWWDGLKRQDS